MGISSTTLTNKVGMFPLHAMVTAKDSLSSPLFAAAIVFRHCGIIMLASHFRHVKTIRTCLDRLDAEGLTQKAWDELQARLKDSAMVPIAGNVTVREFYYFQTGRGDYGLYADIILWIYRHSGKLCSDQS